ncbi:MAG: Vitamin B12-binding protein [Phycisphaerae bacterium]|nr:Vitamin B12-binding protein [Phycisphaerae bacterium]
MHPHSKLITRSTFQLFHQAAGFIRCELSFVIFLLSLSFFPISIIRAQSTTQPTPNIPEVTDYTMHPQVDPGEIGLGPKRIVCIAPSTSELCAALGLADRVVGRTQYCTHPPTIQSATIIGAYSDTNFEKIIALQPDLILITARSPKLAEELTQLQLPYETLPDNTIDEIYTAIDKLGQHVNRPKTAKLLRENLQLDLLKLSSASGDHRAAKVLLTIDPLPAQPQSLYAAGPGSHLDNLLQLAGYSNALTGFTALEWPRVPLETVVAANPDLILEARPPDEPRDLDQLYQSWAPMSQLPVFAQHRLCTLPTTAAVTPGPRINIALHDMIAALHVAGP